MKIAEALIRIKDMKGKLSELDRKIKTDQTFEQIDSSMAMPNIKEFIIELVDLSNELACVKTNITKTNSKHGLTDKINEMETLRSVISRLEGLTYTKQDRVELKRVDYDSPPVPVHILATYNVEGLASELDAYKARIREL